MLAVRAERRIGHHAFLSQNADKILRAGALCSAVMVHRRAGSGYSISPVEKRPSG
jgi:hypothetical protein